MSLIANEKELRNWISEWLPNRAAAQVVLLNGPMGVGKTRFVQLVCDLLNAEASSSPSFAIHNEYGLPEGETIDHLDLYRVESDSDLESTGFWDLFEKNQGMIFIEWAERLGDHPRFSKRWKVTTIDLKYSNSDSQTERVISVRENP